MEFLTPGQKIRKYRKLLNMVQSDLEEIDITRAYLSMIESGKRPLGKDIAALLAERLQYCAEAAGLQLDITAEVLLRSSQDEARLYCMDILESSPSQERLYEVLNISKSYELFEISAKARTLLGDLDLENKRYSEAIVNYSKALDSYQNTDNRLAEIYLYKMLGVCKANLLQYTEALYYFNRTQHYSTVYNDIELNRSAIYNIALCYKKLGNLQLALDNINHYLRLCDKDSDFTFYIYGKILKANCLEEMDKMDEVLELYLGLIEKFRDKGNPLLGLVHTNLGLTFMKIDEQQRSLEQFNLSEKIRKSRDPSNLSHTLIEKSRLFLKYELVDEAITTIKKALKEAAKYNDTEWLLKGNFILSQIYDKNQDLTSLNETLAAIMKFTENLSNDDEVIKIYSYISSMYLKYDNVEMSKHCLSLLQKHCPKSYYFDV